MRLQSAVLCWDSKAEFNVALLCNTVKQSRILCPGRDANIPCPLLITWLFLSLAKHLHLNSEARPTGAWLIKCCNNTGLARVSGEKKKLYSTTSGQRQFSIPHHSTRHFHLIWNSSWVWSNRVLHHPLASDQIWNPLLASPYFLFQCYYPHLVLSLCLP